MISTVFEVVDACGKELFELRDNAEDEKDSEEFELEVEDELEVNGGTILGNLEVDEAAPAKSHF